MKRFLVELRESAALALSSIAAHKLRSGLTLLGILVGVFSIILVMTAMRAMQNNIEGELGGMGSKTFVVQRVPGVVFGGRAGMMKFFRRRQIDYPQALRFQRYANFAPFVGLHTSFGSREVTSLSGKSPPNVSIFSVGSVAGPGRSVATSRRTFRSSKPFCTSPAAQPRRWFSVTELNLPTGSVLVARRVDLL